MKRKLWLSGVLVMALAASLVALAACGAEATPTPTPRPPTPTPTPRPPTPTPTPLPPGITPVPPTPVPPTPTPVPKTPEQVRYEEALKEFTLVEAAARKEGLVTMFSSSWGLRPWPQDVVDLFVKRYPEIKVDGLLIPYAASLERSRAETATKRVTDVLHTGGSITYILSAEGHFINFTPPVTLDPSIPLWFDPHAEGPDFAALFVGGGNVQYTLINTNLVPNREDWPKCYKDLADPKWRNKIVIDDPSIPGATQHTIHGLLELYGEDLVTQLYRNVVNFAEGASRAVIKGEYPLVISAGYNTYRDFPEAPIDIVHMCEGVAHAFYPAWQIYKDAPHMNAAKVWVNFQFDKPAMEIGAKDFLPYRLDVPMNPLVDPSKIKSLPGNPVRMKVYTEVISKERAWSGKILRELGKK